MALEQELVAGIEHVRGLTDGEKERIKLRATYWNNIAVACLAAGLLPFVIGTGQPEEWIFPIADNLKSEAMDWDYFANHMILAVTGLLLGIWARRRADRTIALIP